MTRSSNELIIGGVPLASLLPPEMASERRDRSKLRALTVALIVLVAVVALAVGLSVVRAVTAHLALDAERQRTESLLTKQLKYADVQAMATQIDDAKIARTLGTATEIDWKAYFDELDASLPAGVTLTSVTVESISPVEPVLTSTIPLQEDWVASLNITATSVTVPEVETWLAKLEGLTGFAGVAPPVSVAGSQLSGYEVTIEVRVNADAFLLRFADEKKGGVR